MKVISTTKAPAAIGPYSQAIKVGNLVYTSGQIPIDPATGVFVEGGIKEQTRQSLTNIKAILEEAGLTLSNVVKTTVFLADMNDFADMNAVYAEFFTKPYPARSAVAVKTLPKGALVEIEVVAITILKSFALKPPESRVFSGGFFRNTIVVVCECHKCGIVRM